MAKRLLIGAVVFALLSVGHVGLFPLVSLSTGELKPRSTYFEENSLLPSLASSSYRHPIPQPLRPHHPPEVCQFIESMGLPCYRHGTSMIWTIVRPSFINEAKEVLVLVAQSSSVDGCKMSSHLLNLLHHLQNERWLTKSIVLLVPIANESICGGNPLTSVDEWLSMFHGTVHEAQPFPVPVAGSIRAALIIDIDEAECCDDIFDIGLHIVSSRAALPNMDLPHLVSHAFKNYVSIENTMPLEATQGYYTWLQGMGDMFSSLLRGKPNTHSCFLNRGVDAITIQLQRRPTGKRWGHGVSPTMEEVLRNLESVLRSLNMAEQKLNHGFFLYTFMTSQYFVSIGEFAITVALVVASFSLLALNASSPTTNWFPTVQLLMACFLVPQAFDSIGLSVSPFIHHNISFFLVLLTTRLLLFVVERPCRSDVAFVIPVVLGCLNATEVFTNTAMVLMTVAPGVCCCLLLQLPLTSNRMKVLWICMWLALAMLFMVMLSMESIKNAHRATQLSAICHALSIL